MVRLRFFLATIMCICLLACLASAVSVTVSPDVIQPNEQITISMSNLKNESVFTLHIESEIALGDKTDFKFRVTSLKMPFSLKAAKITVDASPIEQGSEVWVKAKTGSTLKSIGTVAESTKVHISESLGDVGTGTIDSIDVTGTTPAGTKTEIVSMELNGKKAGPDSSAITFSLSGISQGAAKVIIYVDSSEAVAKTVYIGSAPTTTTAVPDSGSSSSGIYSTTISPKSADGLAVLSATWGAVRNANPDGLAIVTLPGIAAPSNWRMIAGTYAISPEATSFDPAATFSLTIPATEAADMAKYQPFLAVYQNGAWTKVSGTTSGNVLSVQITASGKYAIFTENLITPATTITTAAQPTIVITSTIPVGTSSLTSGTTPAVVGSAQQTNAPVTTKASTAAPTTKAAPLALISVTGGLLGALYLCKPGFRR
ncbi:MAG: hypothetical protein STSR0009_22370 [Methanoregula sp.]